MAPLVHGVDPPERFVAGTVGPPGSRTFFLQARSGARVVSVALEKQQVSALAERIDELLDEVMASELNDAMIPAVAPLGLEDGEPLEQPIEEEFRAGTMTLSWDASDERLVIEVFPYSEAAVITPEQVAALDEEDFEEPAPDGRTAPSAAVPWTPRDTCACGRTASGDGTREADVSAEQVPDLLTGRLELHGRIMP